MADRTEPEEETVPDWVMLDRLARTIYHEDYAAAQKTLKKDTAGAVLVQTASDHWGYLSFTLAEPPKPSYLDLHWQRKSANAYSCVLAADQNLLLLSIVIEDKELKDLFVYTATDQASPSLLRLPACTNLALGLNYGRDFLEDDLSIGILRLAGCHYLVADLIICPTIHDDDPTTMIAMLCVYSSEKKKWTDFTVTAPQPQDQSQFPVLWSNDTVLPFDGRFMCWVDYLSGVLLCDLSNTSSSVLHFVPFPGNKQYSDNVRVSRCFTDRFRSVSVSQGMMRFVHIDNDWHETASIDKNDSDYYESDDGGEDCCRDDTAQVQLGDQKSVPKITIWTLHMMDDTFKWEVHREINLDIVWAQQDWGSMPQCLPEFPIFTVDDPDVLFCLLREEEFYGKPWMIMVDMKYAEVRSCTPYVNEQLCPVPHMDMEAHRNNFPNVQLLSTVISKYLKNGQQVFRTRITRPTGIVVDTDKFAAESSKQCKFSM